MNIAHTKIHAAAGAQFCGFANVRRLAVACLIGVAALSAIPASANSDKESRNRERAEAQQRQPAPQPQRQYDERAQRQDEQRFNEQRRMMQENAQNNDAFRRSGRLTPDERRDLRRQINEAGADIYQNRSRR